MTHKHMHSGECHYICSVCRSVTGLPLDFHQILSKKNSMGKSLCTVSHGSFTLPPNQNHLPNKKVSKTR